MIQKNWVLILDFDSTLITIESLDLLAKICCKGNKSSDLIIKKIKNLTSLGMEGKINFQDSLRKRLEYLQIEDYHLNQLDIELKYFISPSIKKKQVWLKENRDNIFILSGGFKTVIDPIASSLGLKKDQVYGNNFVKGDDGSVIGVNFKNPLSQANGKYLLAKKIEFKKKIFMVGDGMTDAEVRKLDKDTVFIAYTENIYRKWVVEIADYNAKTFGAVIDYVSKTE